MKQLSSQPSNNIKISIIFPVHNEENYLKRSINSCIKECKELHGFTVEIILIENGSTDNSWKVLQQLRQDHPHLIKIRRLAAASYGRALIEGIRTAQYPYVVIFNVDFWQTEFIREAFKLFPSVDIVVASKTLISSRDKRSFIRKNVTYLFNSLLRLIFNFQGTDTHGIKIIKTKIAKKYAKECHSQNELVDTEIILRACRDKCLYVELPISIQEVRPTRYNNFKRIFNTLIDILLIVKVKIYELYSQR